MGTPASSQPGTGSGRGGGRSGRAALVAGALVVLGGALAGCSSSRSPSTTTPSPATSGGAHAGATRLPPIGHVFVIVLENEGEASTLGNPAADPYLARTLASQGAVLQGYEGIGHNSADNYIAMISGQAPNPATQADCFTYAPFPAGSRPLPDGQMPGSGCVYPPSVPNVGTQLSARGLTWKAYAEDMGAIGLRERPVCAHPDLGALDLTQVAVPGDGYTDRHEPFVYFQSVTQDQTTCDAHVVPLGSTTGAMPDDLPEGTTGLVHDLASIKTTPKLSFIVPNLCDDGHDNPCINQIGRGSAQANTDAFLAAWVPRIMGSPAFEKDGLLLITYDEADTGDTSACCGEVPGPSGVPPGRTGPGGGVIGAVALSRFIRPATVSTVPYNHYSLLATIEDLFHLPLLGEAALVPGPFGPDVFTASPGTSSGSG